MNVQENRNKETKQWNSHLYWEESMWGEQEWYRTNKDIDTQRKSTGLVTLGKGASVTSDCTAMGLTLYII